MRVILILVLSVLITGCAGSRPFENEPIIDRKGVDMSRYYADKAECEAYADEVRTGQKVARGAQEGVRETERVMKQCLRGRGYRVLN